MGRLIDGQWTTHDLGPDEQGRYVRRAAKFRNVVTADGSSGFRAEAGRYHLYVAAACGWSHRTLIFRQLKGLESVVSASLVHPFMGMQGWTFRPGADPIHHRQALHQVYTGARPDYCRRPSASA